jgi:hypothetical protein
LRHEKQYTKCSYTGESMLTHHFAKVCNHPSRQPPKSRRRLQK